MGADRDIAEQLATAVKTAAAAHAPLSIRGAGTKHFLGGGAAGTPLDVTPHRGIVSYEPTELVITARAGTPLTEIEAALAERGQILGFEPPHFGDGATLGGTIACGLSGPRRPYAGAARDFVLGAKIVNGQGEILRFGGQVMKNVAGFDVSRLMAGAFGALGLLLEVSLKVIPKPAAEITLRLALPPARAIEQANAWAGLPLPVSAACHDGDALYLRLSGSESGVRAASARVGGDLYADVERFWCDLREQRLDFFRDDTPLWRLSVPPATAPIDLPGRTLIDWGGAQRWVKTTAAASEVHRAATSAGGHARPYRGAPVPASGSLLAPAVAALQRNLRRAFDPHGIFAAATDDLTQQARASLAPDR
jgi:glycolate oxidase FAD binding subunit